MTKDFVLSILGGAEQIDGDASKNFVWELYMLLKSEGHTEAATILEAMIHEMADRGYGSDPSLN